MELGLLQHRLKRNRGLEIVAERNMDDLQFLNNEVSYRSPTCHRVQRSYKNRIIIQQETNAMRCDAVALLCGTLSISKHFPHEHQTSLPSPFIIIIIIKSSSSPHHSQHP